MTATIRTAWSPNLVDWARAESVRTGERFKVRGMPLLLGKGWRYAIVSAHTDAEFMRTYRGAP